MKVMVNFNHIFRTYYNEINIICGGRALNLDKISVFKSFHQEARDTLKVCLLGSTQTSPCLT